MAGKGGGAWKVAYAFRDRDDGIHDLWLIARRSVKEAVASHFRDPRGWFSSVEHCSLRSWARSPTK
jgi:hypothetical protein